MGDLVEPVLGDAVEYREQAPVVDGDRLVAHFRVPWDLGPGRDVYNHDALKQKKRLGIPGEHGVPILFLGETTRAHVADPFHLRRAPPCSCFAALLVVQMLVQKVVTIAVGTR